MPTLPKNPIWQQLEKHYQQIDSLKMEDQFTQDAERANKFSCEASGIFLDYSKNRITDETVQLLVKLAESIELENKIDAMFSGEHINTTEDRAALHTALRDIKKPSLVVDGTDIMPQIKASLQKMEAFTHLIWSKKWLGYSGKAITDIVNIGIGGSDLGPKMATDALSFYRNPSLHCHFISNIDSSQIAEILKPLNPETTLFIIASKTFTTTETLTNAHTAKQWIMNQFGNENAIKNHFVAVSANSKRAKAFGIDSNNIFAFWSWVVGRYSLWSAIGLPIMLMIGVDHYKAFLQGAFDMDEHFRRTPLHQNMPVILGLLGIWYRNFFKKCSHAIIPYAVYLRYFPAYLQQLSMESNGKRTQTNGLPVEEKTGEIIWGGTGVNGQHAFHQLLHQGTDFTPIDFIIPIKSLNPVAPHHALLFANCLAQSQALLQGKPYDQAFEELINSGMSKITAAQLAPHKVMPGNRPSNTLLLEKITPHALGALIALYEHKVFVQGCIWNINSFDQWGVELGKQLANDILPILTNTDIAKSLNQSTIKLIKLYQEYHREV